MKKIIILVLSAVMVLFSTANVYGDVSIDLVGETAVLIDGATGEVLYDKDMHKQMYPASTTKVITAILTLENCDLNEIVTIDSETPFTEGSRIYLLEGEQITVEQLLYALLLESANDAAVALAKHISGDVEKFAALMNEKATQLGAMNTNFVNPNGLPNGQHVTTAYDLAMIAKYAMKNQKFREIVSTSDVYHIPATGIQEDRYFRIGNRLLWDTKKTLLYNGNYIAPKYEYATGVKTGYTVAAGSCLIASAKKDGREVISVVLKSDPNNLYLDSIKLLEHGLNDYKNITLVKKGEIKGSAVLKGGETDALEAAVSQDILKTVPVDYDEALIETKVEIAEEVTAPVIAGDIIGNISFYNNGILWGQTNLVAAQNVDESMIAAAVIKTGNFFSSLKAASLIVIILALGYMAFVISSNINRKRRRRIRKEKYKLDSDYFYRNILK